MKIDDINEAVSKMVDEAKNGIISIGIYSKEDDFIITGYNVDNSVSSISNDLFKAFWEILRKFNFSKSLNNYSVVFDDKVFYTGSLNEEYNFTVVIDSNKLPFGFFKTVLLKKFLKSLSL